MSALHYRLMSHDPSTMRDQSGYARRIIKHVCEQMFITYDDLKSRTRKREIVECRQICMWIIKNKTRLSLHAIGAFFDRDHSTVLFSVKNINQFIEIKHTLGARAIELINDL